MMYIVDLTDLFEENTRKNKEKSIIEKMGDNALKAEATTQVYYISHHYCGDENNLDKIEYIIDKLQNSYPNCTFISPTHCFAPVNDRMKKLLYEDYVRQYIDIMEKCDAVIYCYTKPQSKRCWLEYEYFKEFNLPSIWLGQLLPNDIEELGLQTENGYSEG